MARIPRVNKSQKMADPSTMTPHGPADYIQRGWAFYADGQYQKAIEDYNTALQAAPEDVDLHYALGLAFKALGDKEQAVHHFADAKTRAASIEDTTRARMVQRLIQGQINEMEIGDWNLEKEVWHKNL